MPELPEVEHLRRSLEPGVVGQRIVSVSLRRRDVVCTKGDPPGGFSRTRGAHRAAGSLRVAPVPRRSLLVDARVTELQRLGKRLGIVTEGGRGPAIDLHLGMSGQVLLVPRGRRLSNASHVHVSWRLQNGSRLVFRDPRRFGGIWTCDDAADLQERRWALLGPDALEIDEAILEARGGSSARVIKSVLLDQRIVAGIGNIYADESLFRARIAPQTPACRLGTVHWSTLASKIRATLREAIEAGGSTIRDYVDGLGKSGSQQVQHLVYGRGGSRCSECGAPLCSGVLAQRTTTWCTNCQRSDRLVERD